MDPDFHRRDMADSIDNGAFLEWELGLQLLPDNDDQTFEGIDLLDPTKLVPEELAPVQLVGRLTLNRNPTNYFAETEQVAFHTGNLVPGIEITDDPLMQARMFSYLDTQLTRLGGPNFTQLPINCPHIAVNDNLRDGMHQTAIHEGLAPYLPNSIDGGRPLVASAKEGAYVNVPRAIDGEKVRDSSASFADHFSQATLFWSSLTDVEQDHVVEAFTFELGKCFEQTIRERTLANLANINRELCARVAAGLGLRPPSGKPATVVPSPALSQVTGKPGPIAGRVVGVVAGPDSDLAGIAKLRKALAKEGATLRVIAETGGKLANGGATETVDRTLLTTRSIEYDAIIVGTALRDPRLTLLLTEANRHLKTLGCWGDGDQVLGAAGIDISAPGVVTAAKPTPGFLAELIAGIRMHRVWDRATNTTAGRRAT
jgi:catalase